MKINVEKRDIDILIDARTKVTPGNIRTAAIIGLMIVFAGGLVELGGKLWGFGLIGIGLVIIGWATIVTSRCHNKAKKEIRNHYDVYGELPPWPEDKE